MAPEQFQVGDIRDEPNLADFFRNLQKTYLKHHFTQHPHYIIIALLQFCTEGNFKYDYSTLKNVLRSYVKTLQLFPGHHYSYR